MGCRKAVLWRGRAIQEVSPVQFLNGDKPSSELLAALRVSRVETPSVGNALLKASGVVGCRV